MKFIWAQDVVEKRNRWRVWEGRDPVKDHHSLPLYRLSMLFYLED
jgi:hypothetical protein